MAPQLGSPAPASASAVTTRSCHGAADPATSAPHTHPPPGSVAAVGVGLADVVDLKVVVSAVFLSAVVVRGMSRLIVLSASARVVAVIFC